MAYVLKSLGLTYQTSYLAFDKAEQKTPAFLALCPNGCGSARRVLEFPKVDFAH